jgi:hypothetical protein
MKIFISCPLQTRKMAWRVALSSDHHSIYLKTPREGQEWKTRSVMEGARPDLEWMARPPLEAGGTPKKTSVNAQSIYQSRIGIARHIINNVISLSKILAVYTNAGIPVISLPNIRRCISCVPSYVTTDSRFIICRMIGYSPVIPIPP